MSLRVAIIVPTYNGRHEVEHAICAIKNQTIDGDLYVVDSSSTDGTREWLEEHLDTVHVIPSEEFDHGGTRQMLVDRHAGYDIYVFLTQDAYLADEHALSRLVECFADPAVGVAYGRQLPHHGATPLAQHARLFNYPPASRTITYQDRTHLGFKAAFNSNSFAAYRATALADVGGFPSHTILSEDMYVAAKMLMKGWKVAYAGDALCRHSHNYTIFQEFSRYFDIGVFNAREAWIQEHFGTPDGEGRRYVFSEIRFVLPRYWYLLPEVALRNCCKYLGFKLGLWERYLPQWLKRRFSMNKKFWV
nr:glycosyltransferase [uncultured Halomonas sp.]